MKFPDTFQNMTKIIPPTKRVPGHFYIEHAIVDEHASRISSIRGYWDYVPVGKYCLLKKAPRAPGWDELWMSDTPREKDDHYGVVRKAEGQVLLVGLGLGMVAVALCRKKEVSHVTVLEIEPEVVQLIEPYIRHPKLQVILADGNTPPLRGKHFDTIYIDIWPNVCSDNWETMKPLLISYRKFRRNGGLVTAWLKDYIQREAAKSRREEGR